MDEQAWITVAPDAVPLLTRVLGERPLVRETASELEARRAVAVRVPSSALAEFSELSHEARGRCAGYVLHASEAEARSAVDAADALSALPLRRAPSYTVDNPGTVEALTSELAEANVLATIRKLSSYRNRFHTSMTGLESARWIGTTWRALAADRDDISVLEVQHEGTPQPSIAMTLRGSKFPEQIVVLGGHLDSTSGRGGGSVLAPGADDNASGIAVLTEIARAAIERGYRPERTVIFYGYAAEEVGLIGSAEIAAQAARDELDIVGVMQLDMTNYTSAAAPYVALIRDLTDPALNELSIELIETYLDVPWKYTECGYGCSDHASWTMRGFPATFPHEATLDEGNDRIHTVDDTLALSKDSAAHAMHFARFGVAFLAELAKGGLSASAACSAAQPCPDTQRCERGACVPEADPDSCDAASPCAAGATCENGRCSDDDDAPPGPTTGARRPDAGSAIDRPDAASDSESDERDDAAGADENEDEDEDEDEGEGGEQRDGPRMKPDGGCALSAGDGRSALAVLLALLATLAGRRRHRANKT